MRIFKELADIFFSKTYHYPLVSDLALKLGVDINEEDSAGFTMAHYAANDGNDALLLTLIAQKADINKGQSSRPLGCAIAAGHVSTVSLLLMAGAELCADALHLAIFSMKSDFQMAGFLIDSGADVDAEDANGMSPLDCAALNKNMDAILFLFHRGATRFHQEKLDPTQVTILNHCKRVVEQQKAACPSVAITIDQPKTYTPARSSVFGTQREAAPTVEAANSSLSARKLLF